MTNLVTDRNGLWPPCTAFDSRKKVYLQGLHFQLGTNLLVHFNQPVITVNEHSSLVLVFYVHSEEQGEYSCFPQRPRIVFTKAVKSALSKQNIKFIQVPDNKTQKTDIKRITYNMPDILQKPGGYS